MRAFGNYLSEEMEVHVFCDGDQTFTETLSDNLIVHYSKSKTILDRIKSSSKDGKLIHNAKTLLRIILMKVIKNPMLKWVLACGKEL